MQETIATRHSILEATIREKKEKLRQHSKSRIKSKRFEKIKRKRGERKKGESLKISMDTRELVIR